MAANIVIGLMKKHGIPPEPEDDDGSGAEGGDGDGGGEADEYHAAAQDVMDAVHGKDAGALAGALSRYIELCEKKEHDEGPDGE